MTVLIVLIYAILFAMMLRGIAPGDRCECGGKIVYWSYTKRYCERCGKVYK